MSPGLLERKGNVFEVLEVVAEDGGMCLFMRTEKNVNRRGVQPREPRSGEP